MPYTLSDLTADPAARRRWHDLAGSALPAVRIGERPLLGVLHPSQVASALARAGIATPTDEASGDASIRYAWDLATILDGWVATLAALDWGALDRPTPSRGGTIRELAVNVGRPIRLMVAAWRQGTFDWAGALEAPIVASLTDPPAVVGYLEAVRDEWRAFALDAFGTRSPTDRRVQRPDAEPIVYSDLLANQRFHAAFHLRQVQRHLERGGHAPTGAEVLDAVADLRLPDDVFS